LSEYNRRKNLNYSAKEFFEKVFYPLFYDHPKYLQWITNSPFVQGIRKGAYPTQQERKEKFTRLIEKLSSQRPDASIAIGYPSLDEIATTSGQITNLKLPLKEDDYYASWIGGGLGVGVQGGYSIYFEEPEILWKIHEGWNVYREHLNNLDKLRPNQIETWNGQWIVHFLQEDYSSSLLFSPFEATKDGGLEVPTQRWTEILLSIANNISGRTLNGYVFNLGQTNTTIGFIPFNLPQLKKPVQFYIDLFGKNEYLDNGKLIRSLYGTRFGFAAACEMGVIGVRALEPKDLRQYMTEQSKKVRLPDYSRADNEQQISFKTYQTWLLAMLDNKQLWDKANEAAQAYIQYEGEAKKLTTKNFRLVEEVFDSTSKRKFIEENIPLLKASSIAASAINKLVEEINSMPEDSFKYFLTLIKFRYSFIKSQTK
jgi:hypothetical protein